MRNESGSLIVDFERTLYVRTSGMTVDARIAMWDARNTLGGSARASGHIDPFQQALNYPFQWFYDTDVLPIKTKVLFAGYETFDDAGVTHFITTLDMVLGETAFVRLDASGVYTMHQAFLDHPNFAGSPRGSLFLNTEGNSDIPWLILSTDPPIAPPTEQYGFQLFNDSGDLTFDSRRPLFSVRYYSVIPATTLEAVLDTGVPYDLTLPEAIPGAYVCAPYFSSFFSVGSLDRLYSLMMKQVSPTVIRFTREVIADTTSPSGVTRQFTQDLVMLIGRQT